MEDISHACSSQKIDVGIVKQGTPTGEELEELGQKIAGDWKKLGRRLLDINDAKLQEIHEAHDQLSERGYHMLKHWKQEKGSAATYQTLLGALQHKLVQRQDLAEQFCFVHGTCAIQLPAGPVPEEKETGKIPPATAATCKIRASSKDQEESSRVRSCLKRKMSEPNPERGNLSFKISCSSATSRNSKDQDSQEAREKVNSFMQKKIIDAGLDISARPLAQASVKTVGRVQITDHSPGLASTIFISSITSIKFFKKLRINPHSDTVHKPTNILKSPTKLRSSS